MIKEQKLAIEDFANYTYESPITTMVTEIQDNIAKRFTEQTENLIYQEVRNVGVCVDKEELIKALQYDRNQYEKGYADAMRVLEDIKAEIDAECGFKQWEDYDYCSGLIKAKKIIDNHISGKKK